MNRMVVTIEMDRGSIEDRRPTTGLVSANGGPARQFSGYAELIAVLESIRAERPGIADPEPPAGSPGEAPR